jgi:hypothetical protein
LLAIRVEQLSLGQQQLIEQLRPGPSIRPWPEPPHAAHRLIGSDRNPAGVGFERC